MVAKNKKKIGLILSGGGARAAYQIGVLKAISELLPRGAANPFPIICGTSAGAINSAALAIYGARFSDAVGRLLKIWRNFRVHHVFRSDVPGVMKSGAHWLAALFLGGLGKRNPASLLDRAPLCRLLKKFMPCDRIAESLEAGVLESLAITASSYGSGKSVIFYQTRKEVTPWFRARRYGKEEVITEDHLMASSAIPFVFSAIKIRNEYLGDGSMRQTAPISPVLHMGADKVLVIGVTNSEIETNVVTEDPGYPSIAQVAGHILNSIFLDSMEADLERLQRINNTLSSISNHQLEEHGMKLRPIDVLVVEPTQDLQLISSKYVKSLPWTIRFLLRGVGAFNKNGSSLISYLMFEKPFCRELISLGYADAMQRKSEIIEFLELVEHRG
jgi:NTE family protein